MGRRRRRKGVCAYPSVYGRRPCGVGGGRGQLGGLSFSRLVQPSDANTPNHPSPRLPQHTSWRSSSHMLSRENTSTPPNKLQVAPQLRPPKVISSLHPTTTQAEGWPTAWLSAVPSSLHHPIPTPWPRSPCWNPGPSLQTAWSSWSSSIPLLPPCLVKQLTHPVLILYSAAHRLSLRPSCALCGVCCVCLTCLLPATVVCVCVWGNYPHL